MPSATRTRHSSRDLLEEADIRVVQDPDIRNIVPLQGHAAGTHSEGPAGVALRIDPRGLEHLGVHHAGAEDLGPAAAFADRAPATLAELTLDIQLRRWLGEREVAGTETRARRAEEPAREIS